VNYGADFCTLQGVYVQKIVIGERLREERERLGMNQTQFAALGEVSKRAQITYEKGESTPDAAYLNAMAKVGADVQYIVTGVRSVAALMKDETELLEHYRAASIDVKAAAIGALTAGATSKKSARKEQAQKFEGSMQVFHKAPTGDIAGRDIIKKGKTR
jgi:transcriptional regulator with XRE-family HTH domain